MIPIILTSYSNNSLRLLQKIDDQLRIFGNLDSILTNLVFVQSPVVLQQNLIDSIASLCTSTSQSCKTVASTNQIIYEFYTHIMAYIAKATLFQKLSFEIKQNLSGIDHSCDILFIKKKEKKNMQKVMRSLNATLTRYKHSDNLKSHLNLIRYPHEGSNFVRLQRVIYTAIFWEDQLFGSRGSCQKTCPQFNGKSMNHESCKGQVHGCTSFTDLTEIYSFQVYSVIYYYSIQAIFEKIKIYFRPLQIDTTKHTIQREFGMGKMFLIYLLDGIVRL